MANYEEIYNYIKTQREVSIPELQQKFSADYFDIRKVISKLVSEGAICLGSGVRYSVLQRSGMDITAEEDPETANRRAYLEARKQEILRKMREDMEKDDDDDDDQDDGEGGADHDEALLAELGGDAFSEIYAAALQGMQEGITMVESDGEHYLVPEALEIGGKKVRFKIEIRDDEIDLTDDGFAFRSLRERAPLENREVYEQAASIAERYHVEVDGDELHVNVEYSEDMLTYLMRLYAAIDCIVSIDEEKAAVCAEHEAEDGRIWEIVREILTAEPDLDRSELVLRMKERYERVKDGGDFDEIILSARAVKEFSKMSDEDYLLGRDLLSENINGQNADTADGEEADSAADGEETDGEKNLPAETAETADFINETLAGLHAGAEVSGVSVGAAVARYELSIGDDSSAPSVIKKGRELACRLGQWKGVRMYADRKSGKVFIEVPRSIPERETVETEVMIRNADGKREEGTLLFAIGKDLDGKPVYGDLTQLNHILIGGMSGSGKSTFLHSMIYSFIMGYSPEEVRLILCDSKKTEFAEYKGMPHLLTGQIITETGPAVGALRWAVLEMERRYMLFKDKTAAGETVRTIGDYNASCKEDEEKLPRIVIIIDGYSEFVMGAKRDIEESIQRLAQKARAAGIFLVVTALFSRSVTGVLKANFTTRIAFRVSEERDSRVLLDEKGAELLIGAGDMLMKSNAEPRCKRIQAARVSGSARYSALVVAKAMHELRFDEQAGKDFKRDGNQSALETSHGSAHKPMAEPAEKPVEVFEDDPFQVNADVPPLYIKALAIVIRSKSASISLVQRKCAVGYNHAGKIVEWMESMGFITPFDGKKARKVLITEEEFIERFGSLDKAEDPVQDDAPAWLRTEQEIKKMIKDAPEKREDMTVSLGEYSAFGYGIRVYIDYGKDIAYKRVDSGNGVSYSLLSIDIPDFVGRLKEIVSSWEHEMADERILDGMEYHVTFYKNGEKETEYRGRNQFPDNYRDFKALLRSTD